MNQTKPLLKHRLNYSAIDQDHEDFVRLILELQKSSNVDFPTKFTELLQHVEQHFERENKLMEQHQFPAIGEHKAEHQRVLSDLKQFKRRVDQGRVSFARAYCQETALSWFNLHVESMDSALVAHLLAVSN